jgi:hypothetical protein
VFGVNAPGASDFQICKNPLSMVILMDQGAVHRRAQQ